MTGQQETGDLVVRAQYPHKGLFGPETNGGWGCILRRRAREKDWWQRELCLRTRCLHLGTDSWQVGDRKDELGTITDSRSGGMVMTVGGR